MDKNPLIRVYFENGGKSREQEMVYIISSDIKKFPKFSAHVLLGIRDAIGQPKIINAYKFAALSPFQSGKNGEEIILKALNLGPPPRIRPYHFSEAQFSWYEEKDETIYFNEMDAADFEGSPDNPNYQKYVLAVALHEIVHHIDFAADGEFKDYEFVGTAKRRKIGVEERGHLFERIVFGGTVLKSGGVLPDVNIIK